MQTGKLWSPYFDVAITLFRYNLYLISAVVLSCILTLLAPTPTSPYSMAHTKHSKVTRLRFVYLVLHISVAYTVIWQVHITAGDSTQGTESQWHTHIIYNVDVSLTDAEIPVPCAE